MKIQGWMVGIAAAILSAAVLWGSTQSTLGMVKDDVKELKTWKDAAIQQMANMDGKLDALLQAQGVRYKSKGGK